MEQRNPTGDHDLMINNDFLEYDQLCENFGLEIMDSMIEYNLMHLRPTSALSFDVSLHKIPIVVPESQTAKVAMENILNMKK